MVAVAWMRWEEVCGRGNGMDEVGREMDEIGWMGGWVGGREGWMRWRQRRSSYMFSSPLITYITYPQQRSHTTPLLPARLLFKAALHDCIERILTSTGGSKRPSPAAFFSRALLPEVCAL